MFFICCYLIVTIINVGILLDKIPGYSKSIAIALLIFIQVAALIPIAKAIIDYIRDRKIKYSYSKLLKIWSKNTNSIIEARYKVINGNEGWGIIIWARHEYNPYVIGNFRNTLLLDTENDTLLCESKDILEIRINNKR